MKLIKQLGTILRYQLGRKNAGVPSHVYWIITDDCNLKCSFCSFWKGIHCKAGSEKLSASEVKALISKMADAQIPYLHFTGGEPFLREDMLGILEYAVTRISHVRLQTNGTLITEKIAQEIVKNRLLDEIWFSIEGIGPVHDSLRGVRGTYEKVIYALDRIAYFKKKYNSPFPYITIHTVAAKSNIDELIKILDLCMDYGAGEWYLSAVIDVNNRAIEDTKKVLKHDDFYSLQLKSETDLSIGEENILSPVLLERISFARRKGITVYIDPFLKTMASLRPREKCLMLWTSLMISPYGEVLVCPLLDRYIIGDLLKEDLMDLWNNGKFKRIRDLSLNKCLPICEECCVQRRTLLTQLKDPTNFKRVFLPRKLREFIYKTPVHLP